MYICTTLELVIQRLRVRFPAGRPWTFFTTGPTYNVYMYDRIHITDFHLLTSSVNAKFYYKYTLILHRYYHLINIYTELAAKLLATASCCSVGRALV